MRSAYLVKYDENPTDEGIRVESRARLPFTRVEMDPNNHLTLNADNTIKFNKIGWYRVTMIISAYANYADNQAFNQDTDFVAVGLAKKEPTTFILVRVNGRMTNFQFRCLLKAFFLLSTQIKITN